MVRDHSVILIRYKENRFLNPSYVPYPLNKVSVSVLCMMTVVGIFG